MQRKELLAAHPAAQKAIEERGYWDYVPPYAKENETYVQLDGGKWMRCAYVLGYEIEAGELVAAAFCRLGPNDASAVSTTLVGDEEAWFAEKFADKIRQGKLNYFAYVAQTGRDPLNVFDQVSEKITEEQQWSIVFAKGEYGQTHIRGWQQLDGQHMLPEETFPPEEIMGFARADFTVVEQDDGRLVTRLVSQHSWDSLTKQKSSEDEKWTTGADGQVTATKTFKMSWNNPGAPAQKREAAEAALGELMSAKASRTASPAFG